MPATLKIASRRTDANNQPLTLLWFPDIERVSRIGAAKYSEIFPRLEADLSSAPIGGVYEPYFAAGVTDYTRPNLRDSNIAFPAEILQIGDIVNLGAGFADVAWKVTGTSNRLVDAHGLIQWKLDLERPIPDTNAVEVYEAYVEDGVPIRVISQSDEIVTLLGVQFTHAPDRETYMLVETAWLLGPSGATIDRVAP